MCFAVVLLIGVKLEKEGTSTASVVRNRWSRCPSSPPSLSPHTSTSTGPPWPAYFSHTGLLTLSMDRARKNEPRVNKILYEAELRFRKEMHEKKLRAVKSSVDTSAPKNFGVVSAPATCVSLGFDDPLPWPFGGFQHIPQPHLDPFSSANISSATYPFPFFLPPLNNHPNPCSPGYPARRPGATSRRR